MRGRAYAALILFSLSLVAAGGAQSPADDKPLWTVEYIKVKPGMFGPTLGYLDDNWMRIREEAKRQGAVLNYHRIAAEERAGASDGTMVLLTEYKNQTACDSREKLFSAIRKQLPAPTGGILLHYEPESLYDALSTRVFNDFSDAHNVHFQLLAKQ